MKRRLTIFSDVQNIASALEKIIATNALKSAKWNDLEISEIQDDALHNRKACGPSQANSMPFVFQPDNLHAHTLQKLRDTEILIAEPATLAAILKHDPNALPNLKWCQSTFAGVDTMFDAGFTMPLPFTLTRFAGTLGQPIAEWCLARIISHERRFDIVARDQATKSLWASDSGHANPLVMDYRCLNELTLVILGGCGNIGQRIAKAAKYGFGMKTIAYTHRKQNGVVQVLPDGIDECTDDLSHALREADYLVSVLPSTPATKGLLSSETFAAASKTNGGKSPVFLNVGRGDVVTNELSLLKALDNGFISFAILDVFVEEPLPYDNPLWDREDVIVSPHASGITRGGVLPELFLKNYERYVSSDNLNHVVDWSKGY